MKDIDHIVENVFLKGFRPYLWIAVAGGALYFQTLFFELVYLDDAAIFAHLPRYTARDVFIYNVPGPRSFHTYFRPILGPLFLFFGTIKAPLFVYHVMDIFFHIAAVSLFFSFLQRMRYKKELCFIFSLIFLVHPALTQTVAWIPGMTDSILAIFILLSFIMLWDFLEKRWFVFYILHLLFFFAALLNKETAIVFPFLCVLFFYHKGNLRAKNQALIISGWIGVLIGWFLLRYLAIEKAVGYGIFDVINFIWKFSPALLVYIGKVLFPFNLSPWQILGDAPMIYGVLTLVFIFTALIFTQRKNYRHILFGALWFFLFLLPTFIRSPEDGLFLLEQRIYVPLIGFFVVILEIGLVRDFAREHKKLMRTVGINIIIALALLTVLYSRTFRNKIVFWQYAASHSPQSSFNQRTLGNMFFLDGEYEKAKAQYQRALALNPSDRGTNTAIGKIYLVRSKFNEAEQQFLREIKLNPRYEWSYLFLARLYNMQSKYDAAERMWREALQKNPDLIEAHSDLLYFYYNHGDYKNAFPHAIKLQQNSIEIEQKILEKIR